MSQKIKMGINYIETHQIWYRAKQSRGKLTVLNAYIKKLQRSQAT